MRLALLPLLAFSAAATVATPEVPESISPDRKIHAVMDVDRDPKISPEWKGDSLPRIEMTQKATGQVLASIKYFGAAADDARPLRDHVRVSWRPDSKAFAVTIDDRFYSVSKVFVLNRKSKFVEVGFPSYQAMTGHPVPDSAQLRPRGRSTVKGWDSDGSLIYTIIMSPLPSYSGGDPLEHKVLLKVSTDGMITANNAKAAGADAGQPATSPKPKSEGSDKPQPE